MCLIQEEKARRVGKDKYFWKVFGLSPTGALFTVHSGGFVDYKTFSSEGRRFEERQGFQVFSTQEKAQEYEGKLNSRNLREFQTRKVLVKRGAKIKEGRIGTHYVFAGEKACRVSSLTVLEEA